ncbi:MAG: hypothetical protein M3Y55_00350 [Pseudomonadota bacterium]|nr:hypothetical protein [Pseudomonadota bacterium]
MLIRWFLVGLMGLASGAHAAPPVDCHSLAESFHDAPTVMGATALAQTRTCVDARTWVAADGAAASAPKGRSAASGRQSATCSALAARFAAQGPGSMSEANRSVLRGCIDEVITTLTLQPRPANQAHIPDRRKTQEVQV